MVSNVYIFITWLKLNTTQKIESAILESSNDCDRMVHLACINTAAESAILESSNDCDRMVHLACINTAAGSCFTMCR